jgi:hypothetical protein
VALLKPDNVARMLFIVVALEAFKAEKIGVCITHWVSKRRTNDFSAVINTVSFFLQAQYKRSRIGPKHRAEKPRFGIYLNISETPPLRLKYTLRRIEVRRL